LLDWLAREFLESGWDVKRLLRLFVSSATYRQSPRCSADLRRTDPHNRLLARASRYRLDAESIRDNALCVSGVLVEQIGGPSVRPYQPADLWRHVTYDTKNTQYYEQSTGAGLFRRSFYTYWKRQIPPPTMQLLDAPTRETCVLRRQRTNTPLQALALLNDTQFVECARELGRRMMEHAGSDRDRIKLGFRMTTARVPEDFEVEQLWELLAAERLEFKQTGSAQVFLQTGSLPTSLTTDKADLAAWTVVGNTLLNLDEVLTRE
jgi:hypothetical protein